MGEESARLRREIEQTRENLTHDVDVLAEKTSPSKIMERRVDRTKRGLSGLKDKVFGDHDDDTSPADAGYDRYGYGGYTTGQGQQESGGGVKDTVTGGVSSA